MLCNAVSEMLLSQCCFDLRNDNDHDTRQETRADAHVISGTALRHEEAVHLHGAISIIFDCFDLNFSSTHDYNISILSRSSRKGCVRLAGFNLKVGEKLLMAAQRKWK